MYNEEEKQVQIWENCNAARKERKEIYKSMAILWRRTGSAALATILLYKLATSLLLFPLMNTIWQIAVNLSSNKFITTDRIGNLFLSPFLLIAILLNALIAAFWNTYEFSILFHTLQAAADGRRCKIMSLLKESLLDIRHALCPSGWPMLLYSAILLPFTNFFLTSTYLRQLAVPEYIMEVIRKNTLLFAVYGIIFLAGVIVSIFLTLLIPIFILEKKKFSEAATRSKLFIGKHFIKYTWMLFCCNIRNFVRIGLAILPLFLLSIVAAVFIGRDSRELLLSICTAQQAILFPAFSFILEVLCTLAACTLIYILYQESLTGSLPVFEKRPEGHQYKTSGKLIVALFTLGVIGITSLVAVGIYILPDTEELVNEINPFSHPTITCHRGYSSIAPENTLPAFQAAIDFGADYVELDVQMTSDGVVMVSHDPSLVRCTGVDKEICDMTYEEVRELDAGSSFSQKYAGTKIPTLQEVIDLCKGKIKMNIEIKGSKKSTNLEAEVARLIRENNIIDDVCVTALSYNSLEKIKEADSEIRTGYILAVGIGNYYELPAADFFSVETTFISTDMVSSIHLLGKTVSAWTVDREEDASTLCSKRVDDLITGDPEMVKAVIESNDLYINFLLQLREVVKGQS